MFYMALVGVLFFLVLILIAVRFGITKQKLESETENQTVIHTSGMYSIVRKSPREDIDKIKPTQKEICQYLSDQNVDIHGNELNDSEKDSLLDSWNAALENSIREIEDGDKNGLEFYYYDLQKNDDVCKKFIGKGHFITRQNIFQHPELIPPFHLGCNCSLKCHHGSENLRDTTEFGMRPLIKNNELPSLPDWKHILKI